MPWQLLTSPSDYFLQLCALLRDPVYHGVQVPAGRGEPILLIPGFLAGDWTLFIMAGWLNRIGYRAYFSGIHWNVDCPNKTGEILRWRLDHITQETGSPIVVIGHSLGGMLGRFLGANFPEKIRHIVALGSPIDNPMRVHPLILSTSQMLQPLRRMRGQSSPECGSPRCACRFNQTVSSSLPKNVGFTAIFSKRDEIVDWRSCIDPQGENRQVSGRHIGLVVNREVYRVLASMLANQQSAYSGTGG
jgi:pimeloyl-ACP methyl ester carboxylesterase